MINDKNMKVVQLLTNKEFNSSYISSFGINAIPRFILIDPQWLIIDSDAPRPSDSLLNEKLDYINNLEEHWNE